MLTEKDIEEMREQSEAEQVNVKFKLLNNADMNVYIYEGKDRENAFKSLVPENEQA